MMSLIGSNNSSARFSKGHSKIRGSKPMSIKTCYKIQSTMKQYVYVYVYICVIMCVCLYYNRSTKLQLLQQNAFLPGLSSMFISTVTSYNHDDFMELLFTHLDFQITAITFYSLNSLFNFTLFVQVSIY